MTVCAGPAESTEQDTLIGCRCILSLSSATFQQSQFTSICKLKAFLRCNLSCPLKMFSTVVQC